MRRLFGVSLTGINLWETSGATITLVTSEGTTSVGDASSSFSFGIAEASDSGNIYSSRLSGSLTFSTPLTADRPVRAETPVDFSRTSDEPVDSSGADDDFPVGQLRLTADDGNTLLLDANNGDEMTVNIEIVVDGESERFVQPWSLWRDRLRFDLPGE